MLPNFIGLGAARSGSTWIARNLAQHPDVFVPRKKEVHFFDAHYEQGLGWYEEEFAAQTGQLRVGEITPQYFHNEEVAPRLGRDLPQAKLFVSLRNPVDRAYSHYWRLVAAGTFGEQDPPSFEEALAQIPEITAVGFYAGHLKRYYEHFEPKQVLVMLYDDLQESPAEFLAQLLGFLDLEVQLDSALVERKVNAAASLKDLARSKWAWRSARLLGRLGFHGATAEIEKRNRSEIPEMNLETRQRLIDLYAASNEELARLIGKDLTAWSAVATAV